MSAGDSSLPVNYRQRLLFQYLMYFRAVAKNHSAVAPIFDLASLSDEELEVLVKDIAELAHLPPG
jgi:hypothetical protein